MESTKQKPHIALCPSPGLGHLIPLTEFAKRLVHYHQFNVTFIIPNDGSPTQSITQILQTLPQSSISSILLPPVNFDDLPTDSKIETRIYLSVTRSLNSIKDTIVKLSESTRISALVVDHFGISAALNLGKELGISPYVFFTTNAMALTMAFHIPNIDEMFRGEYKDMPDPIQLPGCVPVHGRDLPDPFQDRANPAYKMFLDSHKHYDMVEGIIVNSFMDMEPGAFKALNEGSWCKTPVYHVGPLTKTGSTSSGARSECLKWLDEQPSGSVLYVSFGSGGTLSQEQINELAVGLELSGQLFLWVIRSPNEECANANFFDVQSIKDPFGFLPDGFLDRTKRFGLVVSSWAPQTEILSHDSTGGFITHCGWNSTLESIVNGVPLICWPLYAEQKLNAVILTDDLRVAWRVKMNDNGIVSKEEIARYARSLIEEEDGKKLKKRMKELKESASKALSEDGSSTTSLFHVAQKWMKHTSN